MKISNGKDLSLAVDFLIVVAGFLVGAWLASLMGAKTWWQWGIAIGVSYVVLHTAYSLLSRVFKLPKPTPLGIFDLIFAFLPW
jgi:hypothetical protein